MGTKVAQQSAVVTGLPLKAVKQALPEFARQGLDKAGGKIGQGVNWLADKIGENPKLQQWVNENPEAYDKLADV